MSKNAVIKALAMLSAAYMKEIPEQTIQVYITGLSDIHDVLVLGAVEEIVVNSRYFPTIADIREACIYRALPIGRPPSKESAWLELLQVVKTEGVYKIVYPDCSTCNNQRLVIKYHDESGIPRYGRCTCMDTVVKQRPDFSHPLIGQTIDKIGGYNWLTSLTENQIGMTRPRYYEAYRVTLDDMILKTNINNPRELTT